MPRILPRKQFYQGLKKSLCCVFVGKVVEVLVGVDNNKAFP